MVMNRKTADRGERWGMLRPLLSSSPPGTIPTRSAAANAPEGPEETETVQVQGLPPLETPKKAVTKVVEGFGYVEFPQVSPDGEKLIFNVVHDYATSQMFIVDTAGGKIRSLFTGEKVRPADVPGFLARHEGMIDEQATWSRDGKHVFYRTNQQGSFGLGRWDVKAGSPQLVAHDAELNMKHPFEMKDGFVVCYGGPPDRTHKTVDQFSNLFLVNPESGESRMLTHSQGEVAYKHPAQMGELILAHKEFKGENAPPAEIITIDPATGEERNLTNTPDLDERHPFYNEKRDLIVYHRKGEDGKNLVLSTPDGSRTAQITFYGSPAQSPCWSRDGKKIYFVKKLQEPDDLEHFYQRPAEIRVLDVPVALKDLKEQAKQRLKELTKSDAAPEVIAQAETELDNYRFFAKRYN